MENAGFDTYEDAAYGLPQEQTQDEWIEWLYKNDPKYYAYLMRIGVVEIDFIYLKEHELDPGDELYLDEIINHLHEIEHDEEYEEEVEIIREWLKGAGNE